METIILDDRNVKIDFRQENYGYSSMFDTYKPDPKWDYVDSAGHIHRWDLATKTVPTIKHVVDEVIDHWDDGDHWTTEETHEECILCGEHIEPGYLVDVPAGQMQYIPTVKSFSGSYSPKVGEGWPICGERYHFKMDAYEFDAYVTSTSALLPVSDPIRDSGVTVHFSGIGGMTDTTTSFIG